MTAKPVVQERLTREQAADRGLIPKGHGWDDELQQAVPIGMAIVAEQLERPLDLQRNLDSFKRNRETLMAFVRDYLEEAEYDSRNYPIPGKLHDFYKVPGSDNKALTKLGGEKLAQLFRFGRANTKVVASQETKEYASATVEVTLTDQYRREIGSAVSSCSTAEAGFRSVFAQKKYGATTEKKDGEWKVVTPPDFRAALNDVVSRAAKRAFVQAIIVATSADEVFVAAEETTEPAATAAATAGPPDVPPPEPPADEPRSTTPWPNEDKLRGKTLSQWGERALLWLIEPGRNVGTHTDVWQALAHDELKKRAAKK